jgi:hypothetical protein
MSNARNLADVITGNFDVPLGALDNVPPSNDASALTTGTLDEARIASLSASKLTGSLPAIDGSALTGVGGVASLNGETGAITNTSFQAIGSYISGRPKSVGGYAANATASGLWQVSNGEYNSYWNNWANVWDGTSNAIAASPPSAVSGTWRAMTGCGYVSSQYKSYCTIWVRIS